MNKYRNNRHIQRLLWYIDISARLSNMYIDIGTSEMLDKNFIYLISTYCVTMSYIQYVIMKIETPSLRMYLDSNMRFKNETDTYMTSLLPSHIGHAHSIRDNTEIKVNALMYILNDIFDEYPPLRWNRRGIYAMNNRIYKSDIDIRV